ncbi:hypothetical protein MUU45_001486 [Rodentibacter pneumotropicus]|uniref:Uncharacterized protein n=1 Tax=Rodentibacter pneumotropicus TaxID=758 RepID=A0AAW5LDW5_9PAST|nr:hypothetical protein [Rodentibacter pneumotropicus]MCQ9121930.1 hypothetical protein [Rodentibacter pneumotropicus]
MDLSTISKTFDADFLEVIKFDNLIALIQAKAPNISISFIIESLEKERKKLEKIDHYIPLIFIEKNTIFETINGKKFIPPIGETIYDWSKLYEERTEKEVMPTYNYLECGFGVTFNLLNYYPRNREVVYASIDSSDRQGAFETFDSFNTWLNKFHSNLENDDIYILKRDALSLVSDLVIPDENILLIKYNRFIDRCNRSEDFFDEKEYDEFEAGACGLAFDIWKKDKNIFEKIIQSGEHLFSKNYLSEEKKDATIEELQAKITELENQLQAAQSAVNSQEVLSVENKARRISRPQRDIFTLLTVNNYPNCQSRNDLFNRINADLRTKGITTKDIQYPTLNSLIDEEIRLEEEIEPGKIVKKSPFPPKQK